MCTKINKRNFQEFISCYCFLILRQLVHKYVVKDLIAPGVTKQFTKYVHDETFDYCASGVTNPCPSGDLAVRFISYGSYCPRSDQTISKVCWILRFDNCAPGVINGAPQVTKVLGCVVIYLIATGVTKLFPKSVESLVLIAVPQEWPIRAPRVTKLFGLLVTDLIAPGVTKLFPKSVENFVLIAVPQEWPNRSPRVT